MPHIPRGQSRRKLLLDAIVARNRRILRAANFLSERFPAPDMPISASRSGFPYSFSALIGELLTIACYPQPRQHRYPRLRA